MENIKQTSIGFFLTNSVAKLRILRKAKKSKEKQRLLGGSTAYDGLFREKKRLKSVGSYSNKTMNH